jgi:alkanesulfonate monooxygenase
MTASIFWSLPTEGDGRHGAKTRGDFPDTRRRAFTRGDLTDDRGSAFGHHDHLFQVARAAEVSGFDGVLVPWTPNGEDPWIVAASLARHTRRLLLLPEIEAGFATPVYLAKMSASFQRLSGSRLAWQIELERDAAVRRQNGDFLEGADWFQRADEFIVAARGVWSRRPFDFRGRFYEVEKGGFEAPLSGWPLPPLHTSGSSDEALAIAGRHSDVHLLRADRPLGVERERKRLALAAKAAGRTVRSGLRLAIVARHTEAEAVRDAQGKEAEGALIGSYRQVADALESYIELGIDHLVLEASPRLEEAYRLGEHVLPKLRSRFAAEPAPASATA